MKLLPSRKSAKQIQDHYTLLPSLRQGKGSAAEVSKASRVERSDAKRESEGDTEIADINKDNAKEKY